MFSNLKAKWWAIFHFVLLFSLLAVAVIFSDSRHPVRLELQNAVFDQFNKMNPRDVSDNNRVVIIDIDEKSLEIIGQWPWPRNIMAKMTDVLSANDVKVIAFDGVFAEEDRSSPHFFIKNLAQGDDGLNEYLGDYLQENNDRLNYDNVFASSIKKSKIFITAFTYGRVDRIDNTPLNKNRIMARSDVKDIFLSQASQFSAAAVNLNQLSKSAAGNGSFMAKPDSDGVLRRAGLLFSNREHIYPSLSLEAIRVAKLGRKGIVRLAAVPENEKKEIDTNYRILVGDSVIPVESDGILYVYYRYFCNSQDIKNNISNCTSLDYFPAYKLLDDSYSDEIVNALKDKIILIGASAEGLKDLRSTAIQPFRPGVEVHANVVEQVVGGDYLLRPAISKGVEALFILIAGAFFIILAPFTGVLISVALCSLIIGVASFGAYMAYVDYGVLFDPVYPSLAVLVIFIVSTVLSYIRTEAKRRQIRSAFGMYVAKDVMRDLENHPEKLKLGGENRNLTVMFTDIRRFTSISEGLSPEELIGLMNEFLTVMTDIVMEHHGTVDKYIGDAMMTFWNAPKDVADHEREACLAALKMQIALEPINRQVSARAIELGKEPILLMAGIGINTGLCAVGNMGSRQRFAYSALGDAVNLASRLEGQTKFYGVGIIIGEDTYAHVKDLAALELDLVQVVGRSEPSRIYALLGDSNCAKTAKFKSWKDAHNNMLELYKAQKFDEMIPAVETARGLSDLPTGVLYDMYKGRAEAMTLQSVPSGWDGVFVAQSK